MEVRLLKNKNVVTVSPIYSENSQKFFWSISQFHQNSRSAFKYVIFGIEDTPLGNWSFISGGYLSGRGDTPQAVRQVVLGYTQKCIKIKFQKHLSA